MWPLRSGRPHEPTATAGRPTKEKRSARSEGFSQLLRAIVTTRRAGTERSQSRRRPEEPHRAQSEATKPVFEPTSQPADQPTHTLRTAQRELPYRRPPLTRAQNLRAQRVRAPARPAQSGSESEQSSSGDEEPQRYGVTAATNRRRHRLATELTEFSSGRGALTAAVLRDWGHKYSVGTRHSYLVTVVAELKRRGISISGDVPGVLREAKIELMAHPPKQSAPLTSAEVQRILSRCQDLEMYAVIELMWKTASRLTSITQLATEDVKELPDGETISMTFRRGKTILASGPYTIWARVSSETLRYIRSQHEHGSSRLFQKTAEELYAPLRALLQGYHTRSFRRGAVQKMASTDATLEELRLVTRHVSDQSLYRYLNFGEESLSERKKMLAMTDRL